MSANYEAVRKAISDDLVAALAAANYPPLVDGKILFGPQHLAEHSSPPRVVFVPKASRLTGKNVASATAAARLQRSFASRWPTIEVHVWGAASPRDPEAGDYDATVTLVEQVMRFIAKNIGPIVPSGDRAVVNCAAEEWDDDAQATKFGRHAVFEFSWSSPVLDALLEFTPGGTSGDAGVYLQPSDGGAPELASTLDPI